MSVLELHCWALLPLRGLNKHLKRRAKTRTLGYSFDKEEVGEAAPGTV